MECLKILDKRLVAVPFLCGNKMTIADIIVWNEISQFMELIDMATKELENEDLLNLNKWFKNLNDNMQLKDLDNQMKTALRGTLT